MTVEPPVRVTHSYRQRLNAAPAAVFPLLCPVRETEWVEGWQPGVVYSHSGYAEADCVFTTPEGAREAIWTVTEYDPAAHRIGFVKVVPAFLVVRIRIALFAAGQGGSTAEVSYTYTALSEEGAQAVARMTGDAYEAFMRGWEDALNRYLAP